MLQAVVATLLLLQAQASAAPAPRSTALILGRVVDAASGKPVPGAAVAITGATLSRGPRLTTDAQGRFLFRNLPPGSYDLADGEQKMQDLRTTR